MSCTIHGEKYKLPVSQEAFETKTGPLSQWCPSVDKCIYGLNKVSQRFNQGRIRDDAPAMKIFGWTGKAITHVAE